MKFQNRRNTTKVWLTKFIITLLLTLIIIFIGFVRYFDKPVLGLDRIYWIIIVIAAFFLFTSFQNLRQACYIYFEVLHDKIIIRYYPLRMINQKKGAFEINKKAFARFETVKFFWGMYEKLIIYQKVKNGIARYPAISLSAVDKEDVEKIKEILSKYAQDMN